MKWRERDRAACPARSGSTTIRAGRWTGMTAGAVLVQRERVADEHGVRTAAFSQPIGAEGEREVVDRARRNRGRGPGRRNASPLHSAAAASPSRLASHRGQDGPSARPVNARARATRCFGAREKPAKVGRRRTADARVRMRRLILFRHGKTEDRRPGRADTRSRADAARTRRQPARRARRSRRCACCPIWCSSRRRSAPARRWRRRRGSFGSPAVEVRPGLYDATAEEVAARSSPPERRIEHAVIMVVGHNPSLQELAVGAAGGRRRPTGADIERVASGFPTATAAVSPCARAGARLEALCAAPVTTDRLDERARERDPRSRRRRASPPSGRDPRID